MTGLPDFRNLGQSMSHLLLSDSCAFGPGKRDIVVSSFEKHILCRPHEPGFSRRAIHTEKWTCIVNYEPDHLEIKERLSKLLEEYLMETVDPRVEGLSPWDAYRLDK